MAEWKKVIVSGSNAELAQVTASEGINLSSPVDIGGSTYDILVVDSGGDVKKNMMTLPLIFSYSNMTKKENRKLKKLMGIKKKSRTVLKEIRGIVDESGGFDYARKKLDDFSNNALDAISFYPDSPVKKSLLDLVAFNVLRVK
jgi:geranylgeranyl pyrophosphate synthase